MSRMCVCLQPTNATLAAAWRGCVLLPTTTRRYNNSGVIDTVQTSTFLLTEPIIQRDFNGKVVFKGGEFSCKDTNTHIHTHTR